MSHYLSRFDTLLSIRAAEMKSPSELPWWEKPERRPTRCAVVGLGFIGSTLMDALEAAGIDAVGFDRDPDAVKRFQATHRMEVSSSAEIVKGADAILVAVRALPASDGIDLDPLREVAAKLVDLVGPSVCVLLVSTVPPGTTRAFAEWIGAPHNGVAVAHTPERLAAGQTHRDLRQTPHLCGGLDDRASTAAASLLARVCDEVIVVSQPEVSELSKLLENAFRSVGIGLISEVSELAHGLGISASEVANAAASKPFGYFPFYPGAGVGGHCLPNDLQFLRQSAAALGLEASLLASTAESIRQQPRIAIDRLLSALGQWASHASQLSIALIGVGFKPGSVDLSASPAYALVRELRSRGMEPCYVDSRVPKFEVDGRAVERVEQLPGRVLDGAILLAGDPALDFESLESAVGVVLDAGGGRILSGTPQRTVQL